MADSFDDLQESTLGNVIRHVHLGKLGHISTYQECFIQNCHHLF